MIFAKFKKGLSCFGHCLSLWMFSWVGRIGGAFESFGLEVFRQNSLVRTHWVWFQSFELLIGFNSLVFLVAVSVQPRHLGQLYFGGEFNMYCFIIGVMLSFYFPIFFLLNRRPRSKQGKPPVNQECLLCLIIGSLSASVVIAFCWFHNWVQQKVP